MTGLLKKTILATALAATGIATASPAMARDYDRRHDDGAGTAIAIGAGILGIAAIAAIASSHNKDRCDGDRDDPRYCYDRRGYNDGYYYNGGYYNRGGYNGGGYYDRRYRDHDHDGRYNGRGYDNDYRGSYRGW